MVAQGVDKMETKICTKCGIEKSLDDFSWRDKLKGTRRSECKICQSNYMKERYKEKRQAIGEIKQDLSCAKCGYNEYPTALDFHHLDPNQKDTTVARMIAAKYSLERALNEINKCICLCANCHRVFHFLEKEQGLTIEEFLNDGVSPSRSKAQDFDSCIVGSNPTTPA